MIALVDRNWSIGSKAHGQIVTIANDLKRFHDLTVNGTVIMGRKTYERLPAIHRPLPDRRNIVVSSTLSNIPGVEVYNSIQDVVKAVEDDRSVFVIGGASIYQAFFQYCNTIYITKVDDRYYDELSNDTIHFPNHLLMLDQFEVGHVEIDQVDSTTLFYITYIRR